MTKIDHQLVIAQTRQLTLLYVEDDAALQETTAELLRNFFSLVDIAGNGQEGLDQYNRYHKETGDYYDVVITDITMPTMNGIDMAMKMRSILWNQIIVFVSAHSEADYFIQMLEMGADGFILKPMNHQKMLDALYKSGKKAQDRRMGMAYCAGNESLIAQLDAANRMITADKIRLEASIRELQQKSNTLGDSHGNISPMTPEKEKCVIDSNQQDILRKSFTDKTSAVDYVNDIGGDVLEEIHDLASLDDQWKDDLCTIDIEPSQKSIDAFVDNVLIHYVHAINNLVEFTSLAYALDVLGIALKANALKILEDESTVKKMILLMENLGDDLSSWREHIFVLQDTADIHYLDSSFFSSCMQIEGIISNKEIQAEDDDDSFELF